MNAPLSGKNVVVIAGPSGSGKNVLIEEIHRRYPNCVRLVTVTTRQKRPAETDGIDYHFIAKEKFLEELGNGAIPEHRYVEALDTYYGIHTIELDKQLADGHIVFAQVDIEGARYLKDFYQATTIFLMPESSAEEFVHRLRSRNPEWTQKELDARMEITQREITEHAPQYDYRVVNADGKLTEAGDEVVAILKKEGYTLA